MAARMAGMVQMSEGQERVPRTPFWQGGSAGERGDAGEFLAFEPF